MGGSQLGQHNGKILQTSATGLRHTLMGQSGRTWTSETKQEANCISGGEKQRGIITYGLSANRQNPWAGAFNDAIFNTFRRTKGQIFFWLPPMVAGYWMMSWAIERYVHMQHLWQDPTLIPLQKRVP